MGDLCVFYGTCKTAKSAFRRKAPIVLERHKTVRQRAVIGRTADVSKNGPRLH